MDQNFTNEFSYFAYSIQLLKTIYFTRKCESVNNVIAPSLVLQPFTRFWIEQTNAKLSPNSVFYYGLTMY